MKQQYKDIAFRKPTLVLLEVINSICEDYTAQGYTLTLRQLYYQMVSHDLFPDSWVDLDYNLKNGLDPDTKNTDKNYKKLGELVNKGRLAGIIDWDAIEDRGRSLMGVNTLTSARNAIFRAHYRFAIDQWKNQPYRPEVWVEKDSLIGILERACSPLQVDYFACKGYNSQSEMHEAAHRFTQYLRDGQTPIVLYLGDHDPSGLDMSRDIQERLSMFLDGEFSEQSYTTRLALNWDQIQEYDPPPDPAKVTDSRFKVYQMEFGDESWELDSMPPAELVALIENHILSLRDSGLLVEIEREEGVEKEKLWQVYARWNSVMEHLGEDDE